MGGSGCGGKGSIIHSHCNLASLGRHSGGLILPSLINTHNISKVDPAINEISKVYPFIKNIQEPTKTCCSVS